jgi:hypothetical protein
MYKIINEIILKYCKIMICVQITSIIVGMYIWIHPIDPVKQTVGQVSVQYIIVRKGLDVPYSCRNMSQNTSKWIKGCSFIIDPWHIVQWIRCDRLGSILINIFHIRNYLCNDSLRTCIDLNHLYDHLFINE